MTVIEQALARGDIDATKVEAEALKVDRIQRLLRRRADEEETDIIMDHIGRTNPAAIDRMIAGKS